MKADEAVDIFEDALDRLLVRPRYTGELVVTFTMHCNNGSIARAALGTNTDITTAPVRKGSAIFLEREH